MHQLSNKINIFESFLFYSQSLSVQNPNGLIAFYVYAVCIKYATIFLSRYLQQYDGKNIYDEIKTLMDSWINHYKSSS